MNHLLLLPCVLAGLVSCAYQPQPLIRYETADKEDYWSNGVRLHPARTPTLLFTTSFFEVTRTSPETDFGTPLTFLITVENPTPKPILLDPTLFRAAVPGRQTALASINPEVQLREAEKDLVNEQARRSQEEGADAAVGLAVLPFALLDIFVNHTPEEEEQRRKDKEEERKVERDSRNRHEETMREASARQRLWADLPLRKTTLFPGKQIQGTVSFVPNAEAMTPDTLLIQYGTGDTALTAGGYATLGRYGRIADSVAVASGVASKLSDATPRPCAQSDRFPVYTDYYVPCRTQPR